MRANLFFSCYMHKKIDKCFKPKYFLPLERSESQEWTSAQAHFYNSNWNYIDDRYSFSKLKKELDERLYKER